MHFLNTLLNFKLGNQKIEIYFSYLMLGILLSALFYKWPVPSFTLNDVFTYVQMGFDWAKNLHPLVLKLVPGGLLIIATGRYWKHKLESKATDDKPPIDQRKGYSFLLPGLFLAWVWLPSSTGKRQLSKKLRNHFPTPNPPRSMRYAVPTAWLPWA